MEQFVGREAFPFKSSIQPSTPWLSFRHSFGDTLKSPLLPAGPSKLHGLMRKTGG
jgi:hypothetical protein